MADAMHAYLEERLRITLTGKIPGHQLDHLVSKMHPIPHVVPFMTNHTCFRIANLTHLFTTVRPNTIPAEIFIAVSRPSLCGFHYCGCNTNVCKLNKYNVTIFIDRKELGRRVSKPWIGGSSTEGFEDAVGILMEKADELVDEMERKAKLLRTNSSETCKSGVSGDIYPKSRSRGFTI